MKNALLIVLTLLLAVGTTFALDITIDGEKDDFYSTLTGPGDGWVWVSSASSTDIGKPDDDEDLSANFYCAWDEEFLTYNQEIDSVEDLQASATEWLAAGENYEQLAEETASFFEAMFGERDAIVAEWEQYRATNNV